MKYANLLIVGLLLAGIVCAEESLPDEQITVITSDELTFDYKEHYALFLGNVFVSDPGMKLAADKLTARFNDDNEVSSIVADGNVRIDQDGLTAWAGIATYDVKEGKIVMEEKPRVKRGKDLLSGGQITFWRDQNKMIVKPGARLVIFPSEGSARNQLFGE